MYARKRPLLMVGSLKMNTALEYSTRVVQEGDRRCKKSTLNDLAYLTPLRIPLMNPVLLCVYSVEGTLIPSLLCEKSTFSAEQGLRVPDKFSRGLSSRLYLRVLKCIAVLKTYMYISRYFLEKFTQLCCTVN